MRHSAAKSVSGGVQSWFHDPVRNLMSKACRNCGAAMIVLHGHNADLRIQLPSEFATQHIAELQRKARGKQYFTGGSKFDHRALAGGVPAVGNPGQLHWDADWGRFRKKSG